MTCDYTCLDDISRTGMDPERSLVVVNHERLSILLASGQTKDDLTVCLRTETSAPDRSSVVSVTLRSCSTTSRRDGLGSRLAERCSGQYGRLLSRSMGAINRIQQFAGMVLPLVDIAMLLVAVALLIIGEIGIDTVLGQLR
jgi:hypothetical protein